MPDQEATMRQMVQNHARMYPRLLSDIDHLSESSKKARPKPGSSEGKPRRKELAGGRARQNVGTSRRTVGGSGRGTPRRDVPGDLQPVHQVIGHPFFSFSGFPPSSSPRGVRT